MPTAVGTRLKCPECGATSIARDGLLRCSYCGAESTTQPPTVVGHIAPPQRTNSKLVYVGIFGVAFAAIIIPAVLARDHVTPVAPVAPPAPPPPAASARTIVAPAPEHPPTRANDVADWITDRPMFADVDGDSIADAIGLVRHTGPHDDTRLAAHAGTDGHLVWESTSLGAYATTSEAALARIDDMIVWASTDARVLAGFDMKTGAQRWKVTPEEPVQFYCRANDQLVVVEKGNAQFLLDGATGALTKVAKPIACREAVRQGDVVNNHRYEIKGFNVDQHYIDADGTVFAGIKWPGEMVQMVAASDKTGRVLWMANLGAHSPISASRPAWPTLDFDSEIVAEPVLYDGKMPFLEVFDRKTGERKLDVPITIVTRPHAPPLSKISTTVSHDAIYVVAGNDLQAYARTTGELLWHLKH